MFGGKGKGKEPKGRRYDTKPGSDVIALEVPRRLHREELERGIGKAALKVQTKAETRAINEASAPRRRWDS
jgi:hypothetical protein